MKVIHYSNLPARLPTVSTIVVWLLLREIDASGIVQGVVWTIVAILWALAIAVLCMQTLVRVLEPE